jgi:hypothetical protein
MGKRIRPHNPLSPWGRVRLREARIAKSLIEFHQHQHPAKLVEGDFNRF